MISNEIEKISDLQTLVDKINNLKKAKDAVILAHYYQNIEIDHVADFVGDSLYLSKCANEIENKMIIFAGVYFMAETAYILSPDKKILLPDIAAGCPMADMVTANDVLELKAQHPDTPVVCYVNSSAEVKAHSDICCTSSNAVEIVKSLGVKKVIFVPDKNLGGYVESQLDGVEVVTFDGYCIVHENILRDRILSLKTNYPNSKILAHPECQKEVLALSSYTGSTAGILNHVKNSSHDEFIIATENGLADKLRRDFKDKIIHDVSATCVNMKKTSLEKILRVIEEESPQIRVSENIRQKAFSAINKMIAV